MMLRIGMLSVCGVSLVVSADLSAEVTNGQGELAGEVSATTAILQTRLTRGTTLIDGDLPGADGVAWFELDTDQDFSSPRRTPAATAVPEHDYIVRAKVTGLEAGTKYYWRAVFGADRSSAKAGPTRSFLTLPSADSAVPVTFAVIACMNYAKFHGDDRIDNVQHREQNNIDYSGPYKGADRALGYPGLASLAKAAPAFVVATGDNVYYDTPVKGRAQTQAELRKKWHEQFVQKRFIDLFATTPTYWEKDDHDFRFDDADNTQPEVPPSPLLGRHTFLEQVPIGGSDELPRTFRTFRVGKDLQFWLVEGRDFRSPNSMPDGPGKTLWGRDQLEWLQHTLLESDATFKLLISPTPMIGPDDLRKKDNGADIGGFRHERDEFFQWLSEQGVLRRNFYLVCGDRHWQYHSVDPRGIEEFGCGSLVDENSRLGRDPGDPKSTDPDATIKQLYTQKKPSGGYLLIKATPASSSEPASLLFHFEDDLGETTYENRKVAM
jgi:alkaline phosphatase/alkaline phosphatase D